jgi:hypothetical protein
MSRYAQEHPDEPDFPVDEVLDRAAERRIERDIIARAEAADKAAGVDERSESERRWNEMLEDTEREFDSEWTDFVARADE